MDTTNLLGLFIAIDDVARRGDVAAVEENFYDERLVVIIDAVEVFITANPDVEVGSHKEWNLELSDLWYYDMESWFEIAVTGGQVEVLEWFFAPERREFMPSTLPHLLANSMDYAIRHDKPDVLDFLLESPTCSELRQDDQDQRIFDGVTRSLTSESSDDLLRVLLAHGFDVTNADQLQLTCVEALSPSQVDLVVSEGGCFVGSDVLSRCDKITNYESIERLIRHGAVVSRDGFEAAMTCDDVEDQQWEVDARVARVLVEDGFFDVDKPHGASGRTPLMAVVASSVNMFGGVVGAATYITRMLLDHGADVSKRDSTGRTVLHYVDDNVEVARMLLVSGADPNVRSREGTLAVDNLHFNGLTTHHTDRRLVVTSLYLEYGLDPFAVGSRGQSTLERLQEDARGAAFVASRPQYFTP